jgi:hypothetical protein
MGQPSTTYKSGKLNYVWNYLGKTLKDFAAALSLYSSYKVYSALVSQIGSDDPTVIVLENTLNAEVTWHRGESGEFYAESFGTWKTDKTTIVVGPLPTYRKAEYLQTYITEENQVFITTISSDGPVDNSLINTFVEIRVYN